jgi:hypothetical protein
LVDPGSADEAGRIAVSPDGIAVAVWAQRTGSSNRVLANRYLPGSGWGAVSAIGSSAGDGPQIVRDRAGAATVLRWQHNGLHAARAFIGAL